MSPDDRRVVFASRVSLVGAIVLAACTKPNPAFDPGRDDMGASEGHGSTTGTTGPLPDSSSTSSTGSSDTSGGASGSDSSGTLTGVTPTTGSTGATTGAVCGLPGEPCGVDDCCAGCGVCTAGACVTDDAACGPCSSCGGDGQCTTKPPQTPCLLPADPCLGKVWGLADGTCFANGAASASCDEGGQCVAGECPQGASIVVCDASCIVDPGECAGGLDVLQVDPMVLCAQNGPTDGCKPGCLIAEPQDIAQTNSCMGGKCLPGAEVLCGLYACADASCNVSCTDDQDCKGVECDVNVCN